jgi:hypothetical protein
MEGPGPRINGLMFLMGFWRTEHQIARGLERITRPNAQAGHQFLICCSKTGSSPDLETSYGTSQRLLCAAVICHHRTVLDISRCQQMQRFGPLGQRIQRLYQRLKNTFSDHNGALGAINQKHNHSESITCRPRGIHVHRNLSDQPFASSTGGHQNYAPRYH